MEQKKVKQVHASASEETSTRNGVNSQRKEMGTMKTTDSKSKPHQNVTTSKRTFLPRFTIFALLIIALCLGGAIISIIYMNRHEWNGLFGSDEKLYETITQLCSYRMPMKLLKRQLEARNNSDEIWWIAATCLVWTNLQIAGQNLHDNETCQQVNVWNVINEQLKVNIGDAIRIFCVTNAKIGEENCPKFLSEEDRVCDLCRKPSSGHKAASLARSFSKAIYSQEDDKRLKLYAKVIDGDIIFSDELLFAEFIIKSQASNNESAQETLHLLYSGIAIAQFLFVQSKGSWLEKELLTAKSLNETIHLNDTNIVHFNEWSTRDLYWALRVENYCVIEWNYEHRIIDDDSYRQKLKEFLTFIHSV